MAIIDTIKDDIKTAMKAKDQVTLTTLRGLQSAFTNELVAQNKTPQDPAVLEKYMPAMMSKEEITKIAQDQKDKLGVTDKSGMGQLMGAVMAQTNGQADGADVKDVVDSLLS
jgi:uncharacterized protein YqeY